MKQGTIQKDHVKKRFINDMKARSRHDDDDDGRKMVASHPRPNLNWDKTSDCCSLSSITVYEEKKSVICYTFFLCFFRHNFFNISCILQYNELIRFFFFVCFLPQRDFSVWTEGRDARSIVVKTSYLWTRFLPGGRKIDVREESLNRWRCWAKPGLIKWPFSLHQAEM